MPVTPTPLAPAPCFFCGPDYLTSPETLNLLRPSSDLPEGCECPGCVIARALLAQAEATGEQTPSIAPLDSIDYLRTMMVTARSIQSADLWSLNVAERTVTVLVCDGCASRVRDMDTGSTSDRCGWCSSPFDSALREMGLTIDGEIRTIRISRRGQASQANPVTRWDYAINPRVDSTFLDASERPLCSVCYENAVECSDCGGITQTEQYYCDECEVDVCRNCWDVNTHFDHNDSSNGYDRARYNFAARSTIETNLLAGGVPGSTVLSTRAIGIEIETARGNANRVIEAERNAAVPVLQAVGTDGSVRGRNPVEYRLLPQRGRFVEYAIRSMSQWCREAGYRPDNSAGIHMHVDCRGMTAAQVWRAFAALLILEPVLFSHATPERMRSTYCQGYGAEGPAVVEAALTTASQAPSFFEPDRVAAGSRYRSVNCHSFSGHQTLEIRVFDSAHDEDAVARFTDAAALIAGTVDFAVSAEFSEFVAQPRTDRMATVLRLLGALVSNGHITAETMARVCARLDARTLTAPTTRVTVAA